ncbi:hypothetical protein TNCV_1769161 [Trichonephila clavipes]|nr:hypothetical protein TNCV_1769161 [Trichonephila clavipes]
MEKVSSYGRKVMISRLKSVPASLSELDRVHIQVCPIIPKRMKEILLQDSLAVWVFERKKTYKRLPIQRKNDRDSNYHSKSSEDLNWHPNLPQSADGKTFSLDSVNVPQPLYAADLQWHDSTTPAGGWPLHISGPWSIERDCAPEMRQEIHRRMPKTISSIPFPSTGRCLA